MFLSTDAGSVGLNLQHAAAIVVNVDMPWNPAVLEQRIGRVHRLGQSRGVQVINFVAKGTIEEGMLSVLAFKKSLFKGVLDGGASEVILEGTRLSKFMESVEQVTAVASAGEVETEADEADVERRASAPEDDGAAATAPPAPPDARAPLPEAGMQLLGEISAASKGERASRWIETDAHTGQRYLKLPVPEPLALQRLTEGLLGVLRGLR